MSVPLAMLVRSIELKIDEETGPVGVRPLGAHPKDCLGTRPAPGIINCMKLTLEIDQEQDGRWLAEVPELPGVLAYGASRDQAIANAEALALRVLAERLENGEPIPQIPLLFAIAS